MKNNKYILKFTLKKCLELVLTVFLVTMLTFILMQLSPIDAAEAYSTRMFKPLPESEIDLLRQEMGLNEPVYVQYVKWLGDICRLDFGISYVDGISVIQKVSTAFVFTLNIISLAGIMSIAMTILLASLLYFSSKIRLLNNFITFVCYFLVSIPIFIYAAMVLHVLGMELHLINIVDNEGIMRFFPAALSFTLLISGFFAPMLANNLNKEMDLDSAFYARARGFSDKYIFFRHALPNAASPLLPIFFQNLASCMASAVIVESIFSIPGLGNKFIHAVMDRDLPVVYASILFLGVTFVIFLTIADILRKIIKRHERSGGVEF